MKTKKTYALYICTHGPKCLRFRKNWIPLEMGSANRSSFRYKVHDNIGADNISTKNNVYAELTGLYWVWKHDKHDIVSMCHYRRYPCESERKIRKILYKDGYDVITNCCYLETSLGYQYCLCHVKSDLDTTMDIIKQMYPDCYKSAVCTMNQKKFYSCNVFSITREKLDDYCRWLFPILEELENRIDVSDRIGTYNGRYIGFLSERLFTIYLMYKKYKVYETSIIYAGGKYPVLQYINGKLRKYKLYRNFIEKYLYGKIRVAIRNFIS